MKMPAFIMPAFIIYEHQWHVSASTQLNSRNFYIHLYKIIIIFISTFKSSNLPSRFSGCVVFDVKQLLKAIFFLFKLGDNE